MELYRSIKRIKAAKKRQESDRSSTKPMIAGHYGSFPTTFTIYNGGLQNENRYDEALVCHLCHEGPRPFLSGVIYCGGGKRMTTLSSTTDIQSTPLAIVDGTDNRRDRIFTLPPADEGGPNRTITMVESGGWRLTDRFEIGTGRDDIVETFEWREKKSKERGWSTYELHRLGRADEVVATFVEPTLQELEEGKLGQFIFQNSGASGEMGEIWTVMAVASGLYLCWRHTVLRKAAGVILGTIVKTAFVGASFGV